MHGGLFKDISLYRSTRRLVIEDLNDLEKALSYHTKRSMSALERVRDGFVPVHPTYMPGHLQLFGNPEVEMVADTETGTYHEKPFPLSGFSTKPGDALMIMYYREEKVIVASDVKRRLTEKCAEIEEREMRKVYAKERNQMREEIVSRILPNAQARYWTVPIAFLSSGLILVGGIGKRADQALAELREVLGTLPLLPVHTEYPVHLALTQLAKMQGDYTDAEEDFSGFRITDDFQMQELDTNPPIARMKRTDVNMQSVQSLLEEKVMTHANLSWKGQVSFKLDPKMAVRRVRMDDSAFIDDGADGEEEVDYAGAMHASNLIELGILAKFLEAFVQFLGGELLAEEQKDPETVVLRGMATALWEQNHAPDDDDDEGGEE